MATVRVRYSAPEMRVRRALQSMRVRFRGHDKTLPGKPDLVIHSVRSVIEVRGCFWHGHKCPRGHLPATNRRFWELKINGNRLRDRRNTRKLNRIGWAVYVIWTCRLARLTDLQLKEELRSNLSGAGTLKRTRLTRGSQQR